MFLHNYKYSLRLMLGNRQLVFWTLAFPLIMALLFNMAFSNIEKSEKLDPVPIAVVDDSSFRSNMIYSETLKTLGEGDDALHRDGQAVLKVTNSGMEEIARQLQSGNKDIDYKAVFTAEAEKVMGTDTGLKDTSPGNMSFVMIEYYSLIAMACMYSGLLSMTLMNYNLANVSPVGKRCTVSPARRGSRLLGSLSASFTVQLFGLLILYLLLLFVVRADFGTKLPQIILLSLLGSLAGLTLGVAVAVLVRINENAKLTVLISAVMAGCFFSGMMGITMKNIIDKNVPVLNRINPVAMITDGLYSLYYYESGERFIIDAVSLAVFSAVMLLISFTGLRRQQYDSL